MKGNTDKPDFISAVLKYELNSLTLKAIQQEDCPQETREKQLAVRREQKELRFFLLHQLQQTAVAVSRLASILMDEIVEDEEGEES